MKAVKILILGMLVSLSAQTFGQTGAEDGSKYGTGEDSVRCLRNLSLYRELVKQERYDKAHSYWKEAFDQCPQSTRNLYIDGAKIMKHKLENASNEEEKKKYFEDLMEVYDQRIKYYGDHPKYGTPYVKGIKAIDMMEYKKNDLEVKQEAYNLLEESIDELGTSSQPAALAVYMTTTVSLYEEGELTSEDVVNNYKTVTDLLASQMEDPSMKKHRSMLEDLSSRIERLFARSGAADCETLADIFEPQLEEHKDDLKWLQRVSRLFALEMCEDMEIIYQVAEYEHEIEPSASSAYGLARMHLKAENNQKAMDYFREAIDLEEKDEQRAEYYYQLGLLHLSEENLRKARSNAREAVELRPEWGDPYLLIGRAYAAASDNLSSDEFEQKTAYWAAVDKFEKAKSVDSEVENEADELINTYKRHFPAKDEIFFQGYEIGESYTVGGWIDERTTIRSK
ncbi:MAG: tetratricopeptide repeat protein [Bacteroidota bacterium]